MSDRMHRGPDGRKDSAPGGRKAGFQPWPDLRADAEEAGPLERAALSAAIEQVLHPVGR